MLCSIEKESGEQVEDKKEQNLQQESFFFFLGSSFCNYVSSFWCITFLWSVECFMLFMSSFLFKKKKEKQSNCLIQVEINNQSLTWMEVGSHK